MKKNHKEFLKKLHELCKEFNINWINKTGNAIEVGFGDYYDILRFEQYENGKFSNIASWEDYYVVPEGAEE